MSDLINRQDAIDLVEKWFLKIGLNGDICLDGLRSLPSAQKWIPCSERLPIQTGKEKKMTRETAINLLDNLLGMVDDNQQNDYDEAFKLAIRSLEAWDEIDDLVNKTYWAFPVGLDYCLDRLTEIMKVVEDEQLY